MNTSFQPERTVFAPEFPEGEWFNSPGMSLAALRGRIAIVYFWDDTSLNALQTIAQLRAFEHRYAAYNLVFVGVYTPVFSFAREPRQVMQALQKYQIAHPTLLDNQYLAARAYRVAALPCIALISPQGGLRALVGPELHLLESKLRALLQEVYDDIRLPPPLHPSTGSDLPASAQELRTGLRWGALGNPEGYSVDAPILYRLPPRRVLGQFYLEGAWRASDEHLAFEGSSEGMLYVPHDALEVYAVFSPRHSLIDRLLHSAPVAVEVWQDDRPLEPEVRGDDLTEDGRLVLDRPGLYHLVHNPKSERHELMLRVRSAGFSAYLFSMWGTSEREDS